MLFCRTPRCKLRPFLCGFSSLILPYPLSILRIREAQLLCPKGRAKKATYFLCKEF